MKRSIVALTSGFLLLAQGCTKRMEPPVPEWKQKPCPMASCQTSSPPPTSEGLSVLEASACRSVEGKVPVEAGIVFGSDIGRIYLFTKVGLDAGRKSSLKHVWRFNGKEVATITLPVQGPQWRTYSSKKIDASHKGPWQVDIVSEKNLVLQTISFRIE
jgi:hypothetical protein